MPSDTSDEFLPPDIGALNVEQGTDAEGGESRAGQVLEQHRDGLMGRAGVVMVAETIDARGRPAIIIGVREQKNVSRLPSELDGIPVVVQVIGDVEAQ